VYARPIGSSSQLAGHSVWRFYQEQERGWKWQCLSVQGTVISQCATVYETLDQCVAGAEDSGYVFQPPQARQSFDSSRHVAKVNSP
jgi:hypothetical protein